MKRFLLLFAGLTVMLSVLDNVYGQVVIRDRVSINAENVKLLSSAIPLKLPVRARVKMTILDFQGEDALNTLLRVQANLFKTVDGVYSRVQVFKEIGETVVGRSQTSDIYPTDWSFFIYDVLAGRYFGSTWVTSTLYTDSYQKIDDLTYTAFIEDTSTPKVYESVTVEFSILPVDILDHFEVTVSPDTLVHQESATITVQAKDSSDTDILDSELVDFSLDATGGLFGNLMAPDSSQSTSLTRITYGDANSGLVKYIANGELPESLEQVVITVTKSDNSSITGQDTVIVRPPSIEITFEPAVISPGDTADIILKKINPDKTKEDFPPTQLFEIGILEGSQYGTILSLEPPPLQAEYFVEQAPFQFIAADSIDAGSAIVRIRAGLKEEIFLLLSNSAKNSSGLLRINNIPESEFTALDFDVGELVISKENELDHFQVLLTPDTLNHIDTDTAAIIVQAKDKDDEDFALADTTLLDFKLDANGSFHGNLIALDGSQSKSLTGIQYGDARQGRIRYMVNGQARAEVDTVKITVFSRADTTKRGIGRALARCVKPPPRYAQCGVPAWSDSTYNHLNKTICAAACALSSMSMMMTAFGDTINPYDLNAWMVDSSRAHKIRAGGYGKGGRVSWHAPRLHSGGQITIDFTSDFKTKKFSQNPTNPSVLEPRLAQCKLIIVKVNNNGGQHWVLVIGKEGNDYRIIDPGRGEQFLSGYGSFWSWRAFSRTIKN